MGVDLWERPLSVSFALRLNDKPCFGWFMPFVKVNFVCYNHRRIFFIHRKIHVPNQPHLSIKLWLIIHQICLDWRRW
ncbi:hypothetical protein [Moraxella lacunata]|uniref:hypothetical protein n=1 Tax=Moraxella lacunata TaxID=477 RepID=UPI003EE13E30